MRNLNYELKQLCDRNCDGSFATRDNRSRILSQAASQLERLGFREMHVTSLKPKHVEALLGQWRADGISNGTIKNRMSAMRWWAEKIGKQNIIERTNSAYGIEKRQFVSNQSKAKTIDQLTFARVKDAFTAASLRLQEAFGLRREESIKINPKWADQIDYLRLKESWTKGGKYREVPITTDNQRAALDHASGKRSEPHTIQNTIPRPTSTLSLRVQSHGHQRCAWSTAQICPGPLSPTNWLASASGRRSEIKGAKRSAKGERL